jgi:hypothetical protein
MKYSFFIVIFLLIACKKEPKNSTPEHYLTAKEVDSFKFKISRYIQRLPKLATAETKFDKKFDQEYRTSSKESDLLFYYKDEQNTIYFAIAKIAPSVKLKKTATVGKLKLNENDSILFYKEEFRTWKMEPKELKEKTQMLFTKFINKEDLSEYFTVNSNPEYYIEFPDEMTTFDTISRSWKTNKK